MKLQRALEDRIIKLYYQGKIPGACYTGWGHEAIAVGAASALGDRDLVAPMHRDLGAFLVRGVEPREYFAQFMDRADSPTRGRDGNMHFGKMSKGILPFISHMAASLPVACGMAMACVMRGEARVVLSFFGDGASSTGPAHEAMNFAGALDLPVVFVLENNQFAYSTPVQRQTRVRNLADRAAGYGFPGEITDGSDVLAVYGAAKAAVERARRGEGPTLIECRMMRMRGHSEADDMSYLPPGWKEHAQAQDPIDCFVRYLRERDLLSEAEASQMDARIEAEVDEAQAGAEASPHPDPEEAARDVYCPGDGETRWLRRSDSARAERVDAGGTGEEEGIRWR
ncbi:MAG: thiamine pyrophosphate-dependent dehydrogenase E1 component subunit alpha [Armatimonadetes bacterium]|nr:thiamine pyrophosphate-dependent dehydrogenase E1 component subunit alpha [Armatimonadota bacterium]